MRGREAVGGEGDGHPEEVLPGAERVPERQQRPAADCDLRDAGVLVQHRLPER